MITMCMIGSLVGDVGLQGEIGVQGRDRRDRQNERESDKDSAHATPEVMKVSGPVGLDRQHIVCNR
jgi:hypothetical protein